MALKMCYVCDMPIRRGEPRAYLGDLAVHEDCNPEVSGQTCEEDGCMWQWTYHRGACCT